MIDAYDWPGGREAMLRFGPASGPVLVVAMPLLEEWNRTRAFTVTLLRALAKRGIASVLPDLPGHGESPLMAGDLTVPRIADALAALANQLHADGRIPVGLGIRSGTLVDGRALYAGRWHVSPVTGAKLLSDLHRTWLASGRRGAERPSVDAMTDGQDDPVTIAGQALSGHFLSSLLQAEPFDRPDIPRRVVRLRTDPRPADLHVEGAPLWRRAEPGNDLTLANTLADDIATWMQTCVA